MQIKLGDMGSATKLESKDTKRAFKIGTMGYMSPEMLSGEPFGLPYDIWSLGSLFYCMLTFSLPFWDKDQKKWKKRVIEDTVDLSASKYFLRVSDEAKDLMLGMLEKDPDKRLNIK